MIFETIGRDCLFLNWALPAAALPELDAPLRYDLHSWRGEEHVFLSVVLFRQQILDIPRVRLPKVSYPQASLRLCTLDGGGMPSFFLSSVMLPAWVIPSVRLVARQPARKATFAFPQPGAGAGESERRWSVKSRSRLTVAARPAGASAGSGPRLGSWEQTVTYFQRRNSWYFRAADGLRRIEVKRREAQVVPVAAEVEESELLADCLGLGAGARWPDLHSSWLSPAIPFVFQVGGARERTVPRRLPAPG